MWLHPWVSSTIAWHPGHLRHCLDWIDCAQVHSFRVQGNRVPWPTRLRAGLPGIARPQARIGSLRSSCLRSCTSVTETEDIISVQLTLVPHRLAGYTDPLETGWTLRPRVVIVIVDLHQHRTLWVRTVLSGKGVEQLSIMLWPRGVSDLEHKIIRGLDVPRQTWTPSPIPSPLRHSVFQLPNA